MSKENSVKTKKAKLTTQQAVYLGILISFSCGLFFSILLLSINSFISYYFPPLPLKFNVYQYYEVDPNSDHLNSGFIQLPQKIENNDFIHYRNEETGSIFLVNNIKGGEEYECSGRCYCLDHEYEDSRRTTSVLTNGLYLLVTAFSATLALNMAREAFRNDCMYNFKDICDEEDIIIEPDECIETKSSGNLEDFRVPVNDVELLEYFDGADRMATYQCYGHCLLDRNLIKKHIPPWDEENFRYRCEDSKIARYVTVFYGFIQDVFKEYEVMVKREMRDAESIFLVDFLHPYCKTETLFTAGMAYGKDPEKGDWIENICTGYHDEDFKKHHYNNIWCRKDDVVWGPKKEELGEDIEEPFDGRDFGLGDYEE